MRSHCSVSIQFWSFKMRNFSRRLLYNNVHIVNAVLYTDKFDSRFHVMCFYYIKKDKIQRYSIIPIDTHMYPLMHRHMFNFQQAAKHSFFYSSYYSALRINVTSSFLKPYSIGFLISFAIPFNGVWLYPI